MSNFFWEADWPQTLAQQESRLRYAQFTRDMALELGLKNRELAAEKYHGAAAIRIIEDGAVIFAYKMPGTSRENDWWMDKKLAVSQQSGTSSLRAYVEAEAGLRPAFWQARPDNYAACGGCVPVFMEDGSVWAYVLVSGLRHQEDHQVIADAMAWQLGLTVGSVV